MNYIYIVTVPDKYNGTLSSRFYSRPRNDVHNPTEIIRKCVPLLLRDLK